MVKEKEKPRVIDELTFGGREEVGTGGQEAILEHGLEHGDRFVNADRGW